MFRVGVWSILLCLVFADNSTNFNSASFRYVDTNETVEDNCKDCISKCCPGSQIILNDTCVENDRIKLQNMEVEIYDNDISKTEDSLKKFKFVYSDIFNSSDCEILELASDEKLYLLENGNLFSRRPNYLEQWSGPMSYKAFCVEVQVGAGLDGKPDPGTEKLMYKIVVTDVPENTGAMTKDDLTVAGTLISCFFLLLVLAAYAVLPQKRNLPSLMLMSYVACQATASLFRPIQMFTEGVLSTEQCKTIGLLVYYSVLASFCWLNVMSYDLWITVSKSLPPRWESRRSILTKYGWYSVYGFGLPLLATLFLVGIDYVDLSSVPYFVKPHFMRSAEGICSFENEMERNLYVNGPILVATVINIAFFVLTGLYHWRHSAKPGGCGESRNTKKETRFLVYLKLTLVMGVNWILDAVSSFVSPDSWVWYLPDVFNSLVGLFIFIIFVCKKNMVLMLCKRFSIKTKFVQQHETTMESSVSISKKQAIEQRS